MSTKSNLRNSNTLCGLSVLIVFVVMFCAINAVAQGNNERKVKSSVAPVYPEIARKMGLIGTVKLQVEVAANGVVKDTKVIGGHPILVTPAVVAVKKWRFEPAPTGTTEVVEVKFDSGD